MECSVHPEREAHALCVSCGLPACSACLVTLHGQEYCRTCLEKLVAGEAPPAANAPGAAAPTLGAAAPAPGVATPAPGEAAQAPGAAAPAAAPEAGAAAGPRVLGPEGVSGAAEATGPQPSRRYTPPPPPPPPPSAEGPTLAGKSDGLATVLGIFPGLGHLYLGFKVRGLQLLVGYILVNIVLGVLGLDNFFEPWVTFAAIFFSVFDVRESIGRLKQGQPVKDEPLYEVDAIKDPQRVLAYGLIGLGLLALLRTMLSQWQAWLTRMGLSIYNAERALMAILLIAVGVWLLTGGLRRKES